MSDRNVPRNNEKMFDVQKTNQNINMTSHAFEKNRRSDAFDFTLKKRNEFNKTTDLLGDDSKSNNLGGLHRKSRSQVKSREKSRQHNNRM